MNAIFSRRLVAVVTAIFLIAASGCVRRSGTVEAGALIFVNQSVETADVFAIVPSVSAVRLGTVMQGERRSLVIPARLIRMGPMNIVARLISRGTQATSGPIAVPSGGALEVTLPVDASQLIVETGRR